MVVMYELERINEYFVSLNFFTCDTTMPYGNKKFSWTSNIILHDSGKDKSCSKGILAQYSWYSVFLSVLWIYSFTFRLTLNIAIICYNSNIFLKRKKKFDEMYWVQDSVLIYRYNNIFICYEKVRVLHMEDTFMQVKIRKSINFHTKYNDRIHDIPDIPAIQANSKTVMLFHFVLRMIANL